MSDLLNTSNLQTALDYVMFKTESQRLGVIGGGYGFLACLYGLPKNHHSLYMLHLILGVALLIEGLAMLILPNIRHFIIQGSLLALTGAWIAIMSMLGEGAGGSPTLFAIWGVGLFFIGINALFSFARFEHLERQVLSKAETKDAGSIVKKLLNANTKKQQDVVIMALELDRQQPAHVPLKKRLFGQCDVGRWKVRLMPDAAILIQSSLSKAHVLERSAFAVSTVPENLTESMSGVSLRIADQLYIVKINKKHSQRLRNWWMSMG